MQIRVLGADNVIKSAVNERLSDSSGAVRHRKFHKPVLIQRRRVDRDRVISHTRIALDSLENEWVKPDCPFRAKAIDACIAVARGEKPPSHARRAFITAAEKAGVLLEC